MAICYAIELVFSIGFSSENAIYKFTIEVKQCPCPGFKNTTYTSPCILQTGRHKLPTSLSKKMTHQYHPTNCSLQITPDLIGHYGGSLHFVCTLVGHPLLCLVTWYEKDQLEKAIFTCKMLLLCLDSTSLFTGPSDLRWNN